MATTKVDRFGRVLIPKRIRDNLGLEPGRKLTVDEQGDTILLKASDDRPLLRRKGGVLVFTGRPTGDLSEIIDRQREERDGVIGGMTKP